MVSANGASHNSLGHRPRESRPPTRSKSAESARQCVELCLRCCEPVAKNAALRRFTVPGYQEDDPTDETNTADDRADRDGMFFVLIDFERPKLGHVFLRGETRVTAVSKRDDPDDDQDDPKDPGWFHNWRPLKRTPARDQVNDQDDDRDDEQQVNQGAAEMTDESEQPENQQHNKDSPEHMFSF